MVEGTEFLIIPVLWTNLDCNVGIVVACLPSLRPYLGNANGKRKDNSGSHAMSSISMASRMGRRNEPSYPQNVRGETDGTNGSEDDPCDEEMGGNTSEVMLVEEDNTERTLVGSDNDR